SSGKLALSSAADPGAPHRFVWNAGQDLAGTGPLEDDVLLRFTPARGTIAGPAKDVRLHAGNTPPALTLDPIGTTQSGLVFATGTAVALTFAVENNQAPVFLAEPVLRQRGDVAIDYLLVDALGDAVTLTAAAALVTATSAVPLTLSALTAAATSPEGLAGLA